ncbi:MAG: heavy-metal-associated domain-containing protein [Ignavibacteriaceae bacterium]
MKKEIKIEGMSCSHCIMAVEKELKKLAPASLNVQLGLAEIISGKKEIPDEKIKAAIQNAGYEITEILRK